MRSERITTASVERDLHNGDPLSNVAVRVCAVMQLHPFSLHSLDRLLPVLHQDDMTA